MPKDLDEESEAKAGRRTRAALGASSAVDSPLLRRSTRVRMSASQETQLNEQTSDISGRITRSRMASTEPSVTDIGRTLRSRKNSTASDITDSTDSEVPDVKKRATRRSLAASVESPIQPRVRRSSRAGSESKTMSPAVRSTRKTRASSVDLDDNAEVKQNMLLSQPGTPIKRTRASALPSEPSVAEESEHLHTISEKFNKSLSEIPEVQTEIESSANKGEKLLENHNSIQAITISSNESISSKASSPSEYGTPSEISVDNISGINNQANPNLTIDDLQKSMMDMPKVVLYKTDVSVLNLGNKENEKSNVIAVDKKLKFLDTIPARRRSTVAVPVEKLEVAKKRNRSINDQLLTSADKLQTLDQKTNSIKSADDGNSDSESVFALIDAREELIVRHGSDKEAEAVDSQAEEKHEAADASTDEKIDTGKTKNDMKVLPDVVVKLVKIDPLQRENTVNNKVLIPEETAADTANDESVESKEDEVEKMEVDEEEFSEACELSAKVGDVSREQKSPEKASPSPIKEPEVTEKVNDKTITEEPSEKLASEMENSFQDISADEWKDKDLELADEGENTSDNKESLEKEDEYDLILVDKEPVSAEEKQPILSQDGSDYDSDDTIIMQRCNPPKSQASSDDEPMDTAEDEEKPEEDKNSSIVEEPIKQADKQHDESDEKIEEKELQSSQIDTSEAKDDTIESENIANECSDPSDEKSSTEEPSSANETSLSPQNSEKCEKLNVSEIGESEKSTGEFEEIATPAKDTDDTPAESETPQSPESTINKEDVSLEKTASPMHVSDDDEEAEEKNMALKKISPKKSNSSVEKLKRKKMKITEITSDNDENDKSVGTSSSGGDEDENEDSDDSSAVNIMPAFLFCSDDDSDDDCFSGESDVANDMNLDGFSIEYSDDNVAGDDCRASEEEASNSDDDGESLKDFINDEEIEETEGNDVDDEMSLDEDSETNVEFNTAKKQKLIKRLVGSIIDSSSDDENEPLVITEIDTTAEMDDKESSIESNKSNNHSSDMENVNESLENTSNTEIIDESNVSTSPEKLPAKTPSSSKKQAKNTPVSESSTDKNKKNILDVSISAEKTPARSSSKKQDKNTPIFESSTGKSKKKVSDLSIGAEKTPAKTPSSSKKAKNTPLCESGIGKSKKQIAVVATSIETSQIKTPSSSKKQDKNTAISESTGKKSKEKLAVVATSGEKQSTKTPSSTKKQAENPQLSVSTGKKNKNKNKTPEKLDVCKNLESTLDSLETPKNSAERKKGKKSIESIIKTPVISSLNQTMQTPQISSPDTKSLMKEKLNESLPILKSHRKDSIKSSRQSILETVDESNIVETSPENMAVVEKTNEIEQQSGAKKDKKKKKKRAQVENIDETESAVETIASEEKSEQVELQNEKRKNKKKSKLAQVEIIEQNVSENTQILEDDSEIKVKSKKKKKRVAAESEAISVQLDEEVPKPKKKKKQQTVEIVEESVSNPVQKQPDENVETSTKKSKKNRVKQASESDHEGPSVTPIKKSLSEALKMTTEETVNSTKKKKKTKASKSVDTQESNLSVPKKSNLKRLSTDVLENLSEASIRPQKRRKLNPKFVPSTTMFDAAHKKPDNLTIDDLGYIPLSSSGGTTQFSVIKLRKLTRKNGKTSLAAASFRERVLARHPREPMSAYLMYQQKKKAANLNK